MRCHLLRVGEAFSEDLEQPVLQCANTKMASGFAVRRYLPASTPSGNAMAIVVSDDGGVLLETGVNTIINLYFSANVKVEKVYGCMDAGFQLSFWKGPSGVGGYPGAVHYRRHVDRGAEISSENPAAADANG